MTIARRRQVCLDVTPFYHCVTRCVRRTFLCGFDQFSGINFDHRRAWIEKRLLLLSEVFCIDVAGYAIMSNHYHVVLKVDRERAQRLSCDEVVARWRKLYKGPAFVSRYVEGEVLDAFEHEELARLVAIWREQLSNISRFMGNLNEYIARLSNKEDDCKGRFWESRFKLQAILDEAALLRTLCYVDLNPVRAGIAETPEQSEYTSIKRRLNYQNHGLMAFEREGNKQPLPAVSVTEDEQTCECLPIQLSAYLELVEWTGRVVSEGKRGSIAQDVPSIVRRMGYTSVQWVSMQSQNKSWTQRALGRAGTIRRYCVGIGQRWIWQTKEGTRSHLKVTDIG